MNPRSGRRAVLPESVHHRPAVLEPGTLVVRHIAEQSRKEAVYDFGALPLAPQLQRELAELFAGQLGPAGSWRALPTSSEIWQKVVTFAGWLAAREPGPQQFSELTVGIWNAWRLSRADSTVGRREVSKLGPLLAKHPALPAPVRELMTRRMPTETRREVAYQPHEFDRIKKLATQKVRAALRRIREHVELVEQWRTGQLPEGTEQWLAGEALDHIARTGDLPNHVSISRTDQSRRVRPPLRHLDILGASPWRRLFLTGEEASSLAVLLVATYGWNATPVSELTVPDTTPNAGPDGHTIYRVELHKRRRGGAGTVETRNLTDWGADSPGRLIAQAIEMTAPARAVLAADGAPTDRLLVWRLNRVRDPQRPNPAPELFRSGVDDHTFRNMLKIWKTEHGMSVSLRRLRKTVIVLHNRTPTQHTQDTHDQIYVLPDPQTWQRSSPIIAEGIESALVHARTTFTARTSRTDLPGAQDTVTAGCTGYTHSPFGEDGAPCRASFLLCTACSNAVIMPRHLPRLAYLQHALDELRGVIGARIWDQEWRHHHARLADLRTRPDFTAAEWRDALAEVTEHDRTMIDHLLRNRFDA
ncbi:hypothetical protein [Amycolatopsis sp. NPDC051102]|uniref:hypothetical protein n=1 Tax=Amycolatopsis sp. NPDC051102 TaxID=3155163 RepID=UPI003430A0B8